MAYAPPHQTTLCRKSSRTIPHQIHQWVLVTLCQVYLRLLFKAGLINFLVKAIIQQLFDSIDQQKTMYFIENTLLQY